MTKSYLLGLGSAIFALLLFSISPLKAGTYSDEIAFAEQTGEEILALKATTKSASIRKRDRRKLEYRLRVA